MLQKGKEIVTQYLWNEPRRTSYWVVMVGAIVLTLVLVFHFVVLSPIVLEFLNREPLTGANRLTATSILVSGLLTFVLMVVYRDLVSIQKQQTNIMNMEREADVLLNSWSVTGNNLTLVFSNVGKGIARNLRIDLLLLPKNVDHIGDFSQLTTPAFQKREDLKVDFLRDGKTQRFVAKAVARTCVINVQHWPFTRVINHLINQGESEAELLFSFLYDDPLGNTIEGQVASVTFEISKGMTFESAISACDYTNTVPRPIPPDRHHELASQMPYNVRAVDPRFDDFTE